MPGPLLPLDDEECRLSALHALDLLDTVTEREFDALAALAARLLECPKGLVTLIDRDRQWVKARHGIEIVETSRDVAFCDHTIRTRDGIVVNDTAADPRFSDNPYVLGAPNIRFYAGVPIHATDREGRRHAIGAVCALDSVPRQQSDNVPEALAHLALLAEAIITARTTAIEALAIATKAREQEVRLRRQERTFRQAERLTMIGSWTYRLDVDTVEWSEGVYRIHEIDPDGDRNLNRGLEHYPPHARAEVAASLARTIETGAPFEIEADFITARGRQRRVRSIGELELEDGRASAVVGVFQDVTDAYRLERSLRESASVDAVTGIANRAAFNEAIEAALRKTEVDGQPLVLVLIDLDNFKTVNDTFGHLAGDDVLRAVGERLRSGFLGGTFPARLGGDEFGLLVTDPDLIAAPHEMTDRLLTLLSTPVRSGDGELAISGTVGVAAVGPGRTTARALMHAADTALYAAKRTRRGTAQFDDAAVRSAPPSDRRHSRR